MKEIVEHDANCCVPTYVSTCEKDIYPIGKIESKKEINPLERPIGYDSLTENAFSAREINLENILTQHHEKFETSRIFKKLSKGELNPSDYLCFIESYIHQELISSHYFEEIKNLACKFSGNLTSFFGFESRLNSSDTKSGYQFAISSRRGEREAIANLIKNGQLPEIFIRQPEWQRVRDFIIKWADPNSVLYNNVLGIWFEFDMDGSNSEASVPSMFLNTIPFNSDSTKDTQKCSWLTQLALPLLTGQSLSKKIQQRLLQCIQKLPERANIIQFGVMLSRPNKGMRILVNHIRPSEIMPYLEMLDWSGEPEKLSQLITELEKNVTRFSISIDLLENGIGPKIGIECSYYPKHRDLYQPEPRWIAFLDYLVKKNLCTPEKRDGLIDFLPEGKNQDEYKNYARTPLIIATKISNDACINVLVRQMGHVKIIYQPDHPLEAKGYFGARLFGTT